MRCICRIDPVKVAGVERTGATAWETERKRRAPSKTAGETRGRVRVRVHTRERERAREKE